MVVLSIYKIQPREKNLKLKSICIGPSWWCQPALSNIWPGPHTRPQPHVHRRLSPRRTSIVGQHSAYATPPPRSAIKAPLAASWPPFPFRFSPPMLSKWSNHCHRSIHWWAPSLLCLRPSLSTHGCAWPMRYFVARAGGPLLTTGAHADLRKTAVSHAQPPNTGENSVSASHRDPFPTSPPPPSSLDVVAGAPVRRFGSDQIEPKSTLDLIFFLSDLFWINSNESKIFQKS
jgi:hypothetical protein